MIAAPQRRFAALIAFAVLAAGCAARGHVATPDELALLREASGLSASGKITLSGPGGRFSTRMLIGVAKPDLVRLEIPAGTGLRFRLITNGETLLADLPGEAVFFRGASSRGVLEALFGVEIEPRDLVAAVLGNQPTDFRTAWRFDRALPVHMKIDGREGRALAMSLDDTELAAPSAEAFVVDPPRSSPVSLEEMSSRLGLRR